MMRALSAGDRIGPFELVAEIGRGGYGAVWRARRVEPYRQEVAVKFLRLGLDSEAIVSRFERERQALALMNHPGIARVLDGGRAADGRPYLVMEFVDGRPITAWCAAERLSVRERVALLAQVCDAVQHAHAKGMIHRDLKPSNILALRDGDGRAVARVIDFGIAKLIDGSNEGGATVTEAGQLIGTPEYMSPEQADPDGADVDTRSDVYGLGAVLHELLVGRPPFGGSGAEDGAETRSRAMLLRAVRTETPAPPSARAPGLARELDWIVLKALRKEPEERYASAAELARDLRSFLSGDALLAAPESAAYRFRSYARRNRAQVVAGAIVLSTLVLASAVSVWFALRERDARRESDLRAEEARRTADFQAELLDRIDPAFVGAWAIGDLYKRGDAYLKESIPDAAELKAQRLVFNKMMRAVDRSAVGNEVVTKTFLGPATASVETRFEDLPRAAASIHRALARRYQLVADFPQSLHHAERAIELHRAALGARHREVGRDLTVRGVTLFLIGRRDEAEAAFLEADGILRETCGDDSAELLENTVEYARIVHGRGDHAASAALLAGGVATAERLFGADEPRFLGLRRDYARSLAEIGRAEEAERIARQVLERFTAVNGPDGPGALRTVLVLSLAVAKQGRFAEAEGPLVDAVGRATRIYGAEDSDTLWLRYALLSMRVKHGPEPVPPEEVTGLRAVWAKRFGAETPEVRWMDGLMQEGGGTAVGGPTGSSGR